MKIEDRKGFNFYEETEKNTIAREDFVVFPYLFITDKKGHVYWKDEPYHTPDPTLQFTLDKLPDYVILKGMGVTFKELAEISDVSATILHKRYQRWKENEHTRSVQ